MPKPCLLSVWFCLLLLLGCSAPAAPLTPTATPAVPPQAAPAQTPTTSSSEDSGVSFTLTWYGQSAFLLTSSTGLKALLDPAGPGTGYTIPRLDGIDVVTVSHEHSDHNDVGLASGSPLILRGLASGDWASIDQTLKGVRIRSVGVYHDEAQGAQRGKNAVFIFELPGLRLAHLGDLGHLLSPEQLQAIGPVDAVLIPVGGTFTITGKTAVEVIDQLKPRLVVPMHYKTPAATAPLSTADEFLQAVSGKAAVIQAGDTLTLTPGSLPASLTVMVMSYKK